MTDLITDTMASDWNTFETKTHVQQLLTSDVVCICQGQKKSLSRELFSNCKNVGYTEIKLDYTIKELDDFISFLRKYNIEKTIDPALITQDHIQQLCSKFQFQIPDLATLEENIIAELKNKMKFDVHRWDNSQNSTGEYKLTNQKGFLDKLNRLLLCQLSASNIQEKKTNFQKIIDKVNNFHAKCAYSYGEINYGGKIYTQIVITDLTTSTVHYNFTLIQRGIVEWY